MNEKELTNEFDLDDILREFSEHPEKLPAQEPEAPAQEDEDIQLYESEEAAAAEDVPVSADTVRLDDLSKVLQEQHPVGDETQRFTPVGGEEEPEGPEIYVEDTPQVEPFSEEWEPQYEDPIGEYVPQEPIVFRPKSRLMELKRKLIEGPEKRYYELVELGMGKLQLAILINLIIAIVAIGATVLYTTGRIPAERMRLAVFSQCFALLMSALLGSYQLMDGVSDIFRGRFSLNSLLVFSLGACILDAVMCLRNETFPCSAVFSLNMTMSLWSTYQKRNTEMGQMDTLRKAVRLDGIVRVPGYHEERPGYVRTDGELDAFMDQYRKPSRPEQTISVYGLVALIVSIAIGVFAGVQEGFSVGVRMFAAALLVAMPATAYVSLSRPAAILERRFHSLGTVLCGWKGIRGFAGHGYFPLSDNDLFPAGSVKVNGVKFYGKRDPDDVVAYGTAVISANGGIMTELFNQLLDSRKGYHYPVQELRCYENGGIGGIVNNEAVLVGSLNFMKEMGVDMPEGTRVTQAVYVAVDGELCGVFAVTYQKVKSAAAGLGTLCGYRGIRPVLVSEDFMLTESFLRSKFSVNTRRIKFPEMRVRSLLKNTPLPEEPETLALTTVAGLAPAAYAATGARILRSASIAGVTIHMIGGILGVLMMAALAVAGGTGMVTAANILLYELIWMVPGLLVTEWTRHI